MDARTTQHRRKGRGERSLALAIALSFVFSSLWAASPKLHFNVPAGTLRESFKAFTRQAKIDGYYVLGEIPSADAVQTQAVIGEFTISEALRKMLEGSGMKFRFASDGSLLIEPVKAVGAALETDAGDAQEVVVTGSFIRGLDAITAPLVIVNRNEMKQAAYGTVQDVLRTLPFNFGGGANEDFSVGSANFSRGSSVNLRGLGTGATLVLIDGRRQPVSGIGGDFVDVSTLPWSAVDRIEIIADGSSALYGSDAIAGVVNVIMRKDLPGVGETQARLGAALGGADERLLAQFFSHHWDSGHGLLTYQYSERTELAAGQRSYAANADKRPLGGSDLRSIFSNPGNIIDPFSQDPVLGIPSGQDGRSLTADALLPGIINLQNQLEFRDLLPNRTTHNLFLTASQKVAENFELFVQGRYSHRDMTATERGQPLQLLVPAGNPFFVDPFGGSPFVIVAYDFVNEFGPIRHKGKTETYTGSLGITAHITDHWQANMSGYVGREDMDWRGYGQTDPMSLALALADPDPATAFNPFGSGANTSPAILDSLLYVQQERAISQVKTVNALVDGPLPELPTGTPKLALGVDRRHEGLFRDETQGRDIRVSGEFDRTIAAAFGELSLPLSSRMNLSLAARYERYSDFGDTFNPKIGIRWSVTDSLRFRGSWGSSFRAPTLVDLYDHSQDVALMFPLADPRSASGFSLVLAQAGSNPKLHEERARTWTAGLDFAPEAILGLSSSLTYYSIDYKDRIFYYPPTVALETLLVDEKWSALVTRDPTRSEIEGVCNSPVFFDSVADCLASTPAAILDLRVRNLSATAVNGVDLELKYALQTDYGRFNFGLNGSYVLNFEQALTRAVPASDLVGMVLNPPRLRFRNVAEWSRHGRDQPGFSASMAMDYLDSFKDYGHSPVNRIGATATFDMQLNYRTEKSGHWLGDVDLTLNAVNIFNEDPPFVNHEIGYDPANTKPYGRVISLGLQKGW